VRISSLGPRPYSFITSLYRNVSRISCWPRMPCHHRIDKVNDRYMFRNKDFFSFLNGFNMSLNKYIIRVSK
jgi:hypothetical protein